VWSLWSDLDNGGFNFPRSMLNTPIPGSPLGGQGQLSSGVGVNASIGYGNYNAGFASLRMSDWKGVTLQSNFTWSKALGTGAVLQATSGDTPVDPFNLHTNYGVQEWDRSLVWNLFVVYQPKWYSGQQGWKGHLLGGWTFAPIIAAGSGLPVGTFTINGGGQAFGEGDSVNFAGNGVSENAIPIGPIPSAGVNKSPGSGTGSANPLNMFANPAAALNNVRQPILGYDTKDGGFGFFRGLGYWNVDFSMKKQFKITERFSTEFQVVFTNLFNHPVFYDPQGQGFSSLLDTSSPTSWGNLPGQGNMPRQMEFGFRFNF
jgi:hypothetical protein